MSEILSALSPYVGPITLLALAVLIRVCRNSVTSIKHGNLEIKFRKDSKSR